MSLIHKRFIQDACSPVELIGDGKSPIRKMEPAIDLHEIGQNPIEVTNLEGMYSDSVNLLRSFEL